METGPEVKADAGHDLALTELPSGFVLEAGTVAYDGPSDDILGDAALLERFGLEAT